MLAPPRPYEAVLRIAGTRRIEHALISQYVQAVGLHSLTVLYDDSRRPKGVSCPFCALSRPGGGFEGKCALCKPNQTASSAYLQKLRSRLPPLARYCGYTFEGILYAFPRMRERFGALHSSVRSKHWVNQHGLGGLEVVLWAANLLKGQSCIRNESARALADIWALESDAFFVGDPGRFFEAFVADSSDLLTTGLTIADQRWWAHALRTLQPPFRFTSRAVRVRTSLSSEEPLEARMLCNISMWSPNDLPEDKRWRSRAKEDYWRRRDLDLRAGPGQCTTQSGVIFRMTFVERLSAKLIAHLESLLSDGRFAQSEFFAPTACAAQPWCRIGDWARGEISPMSGYYGVPPRGFRSPHYFFVPARYVELADWCDVCGSCEAMRTHLNRWVHPVGEAKYAGKYSQSELIPHYLRIRLRKAARNDVPCDPIFAKSQAAVKPSAFPRCPPKSVTACGLLSD